MWCRWAWVSGGSEQGKGGRPWAGPQGSRSQEKLLSTYWPPKSCIPRRAKTTMNRKRRNNRLTDGFHGVEKRDDQVPERCPVPAKRGQGWGIGVRLGPGWQ